MENLWLCSFITLLYFSSVKFLCVFCFEQRVSIFWWYFYQLYFWKGESAGLILYLQVFWNCVYLLSFCFVFPNYNTAFPLFIANEKINKEEQLWTAVILSSKYKAFKNGFFSQGFELFQNRKKCIICTMLNDQLFL